MGSSEIVNCVGCGSACDVGGSAVVNDVIEDNVAE